MLGPALAPRDFPNRVKYVLADTSCSTGDQKLRRETGKYTWAREVVALGLEADLGIERPSCAWLARLFICSLICRFMCSSVY